jgi:hypothetical protein
MASQGIDLIGGKIWISSLTATAGLKKPQPGPDIRQIGPTYQRWSRKRQMPPRGRKPMAFLEIGRGICYMISTRWTGVLTKGRANVPPGASGPVMFNISQESQENIE